MVLFSLVYFFISFENYLFYIFQMCSNLGLKDSSYLLKDQTVVEWLIENLGRFLKSQFWIKLFELWHTRCGLIIPKQEYDFFSCPSSLVKSYVAQIFSKKVGNFEVHVQNSSTFEIWWVCSSYDTRCNYKKNHV